MVMEKRTRSKSKITKPKAKDHAKQAHSGPVKKKVKVTTSTKIKPGERKTKTTTKTVRTVRTKAKMGTAKKAKFATSDPNTLLKYDFERLAPSKSPIPSGYVFVPKGDVYITRQCRQLTAAAEQTLYVVYDERTNDRLGLRCPKKVCSEVLIKAEATNENRKQAVEAKDRKDREAAQESILRQFPSIGLNIAREILDHGFEKRSGRVGRTGTLGLDEKVTLAVAAYARHKFTPYDQLLREARKEQGWNSEAKWPVRRAVQPEVNEVLKRWRKRAVTRRASKTDDSKEKETDDGKPIKRTFKRHLDAQSSKYKNRLAQATKAVETKKIPVLAIIRAKRQKK